MESAGDTKMKTKTAKVLPKTVEEITYGVLLPIYDDLMFDKNFNTIK
jgi:hypothetical protein